MGKELEVFDYGSLTSNEAQAVQSDAEWVRSTYRTLQATTAETMIAIGERLLRVRETIGHGKFLPWLASEFEFSRMSALRMMQAADHFGGEQMSHVLHLPHRTIYALAAPSTPEPVRTLVKERAGSGEALDAKQIDEEIRRAKEVARQAEALAKRTPQDALRARREAKAEADRKAEQEAQFAHERKQAQAAFDLISPLLGGRMTEFAALIQGPVVHRFSQLIQAAARESAA